MLKNTMAFIEMLDIPKPKVQSRFKKDEKISEVPEPKEAETVAEVIGGLTTFSLGDVEHFFSIEPGVQEGPVGTLHPKAPMKFNKGEVVVNK